MREYSSFPDYPPSKKITSEHLEFLSPEQYRVITALYTAPSVLQPTIIYNLASMLVYSVINQQWELFE